MIEYQGNGIETIYCIQKDKIEQYLEMPNKGELETQNKFFTESDILSEVASFHIL